MNAEDEEIAESSKNGRQVSWHNPDRPKRVSMAPFQSYDQLPPVNETNRSSKASRSERHSRKKFRVSSKGEAWEQLTVLSCGMSCTFELMKRSSDL
jgi:hypothetical protein